MHAIRCASSVLPITVKFAMNQQDQELFDLLYAQHLEALKLKGKHDNTIDGYARAVLRFAGFFDRCPGNLSLDDLKQYYSWTLKTTPGAASR